MIYRELKEKFLRPVPEEFTVVVPSELSVPTLAQLFKVCTRCPVKELPDRVNIPGMKIPISVRYDEEMEFMLFSAGIRFRDHVPAMEKIQYADFLNAEKLMARCSVIDDTALYFDYTLVCDDAILCQTILNSQVRFEMVVCLILVEDKLGKHLLDHTEYER